jgi:CRISPR-associated endonuclease Cas2
MGQLVVVAYVIADDKRRTCLFKLLLRFGTPVQFSVFECLLKQERLRTLQSAMRKIIRPRLLLLSDYDRKLLSESVRSAM